jgi:hypothetical protein
LLLLRREPQRKRRAETLNVVIALRPFIFIARVAKLRRYKRQVHWVNDPASIIGPLMVTFGAQPSLRPWRRHLDEVFVKVNGWIGQANLRAPLAAGEASMKRVAAPA